MQSVLSRILPPPSFLTMSCVGLDISDNSLKHIAFYPTARAKNERRIKSWGDIDIPNGVIERGQISDMSRLVSVLGEFQSQTGAEFVRLSLPEERAYLFETEVKDNVPYKEIRNLMEFRLEENVPIPSRDVLFDFALLPQVENRNVVKVAVAAYDRNTIDQYYEACYGAGLFPVSFEIEAQAMARAMVPKDVSGAVMIVDFGKTRTGIGIVYQNTLLYTSTIDVAGNQLSAALRRVLGENIAEAELTAVKNNQGLVRGVDSSDVRDSMLGVVSVIKDEIATRMQYWHLHNSNDSSRKIGLVILCGGSVNLRGLPEYLTESIGIPCTRGNVWENAFSLERTVPPISRRHSFGYASAIGLALKSYV